MRGNEEKNKQMMVSPFESLDLEKENMCASSV